MKKIITAVKTAGTYSEKRWNEIRENREKRENRIKRFLTDEGYLRGRYILGLTSLGFILGHFI